jgi:hypothetical protein
LSDNPEILIIWYLRRVVLTLEILLFTIENTSSMKQADLGIRFDKDSKSVHTTTVLVCINTSHEMQLCTVASHGMYLYILKYDARNHEPKKNHFGVSPDPLSPTPIYSPVQTPENAEVLTKPNSQFCGKYILRT